MSIQLQPRAISLADEPSTSPPPGTLVNFNTTDTRAPMAIAVMSSFMGIMFMFVGIRVYVKVRIDKRATWDDLTLAFSVLSVVAIFVVSILGKTVTDYGERLQINQLPPALTLNEFGKHMWDIPLSVTDSNQSFKIEWLLGWMTILPYIFIKLSLFLLYLQIFHPFLWLKICIIAGAIVVTGVYVAALLGELIAQTPRPGQTWYQYFQASHAHKGGVNVSWALAAWALASDVYLLVLPIAGVARLQVSARRKFAVIMAFMTGLGACICSALSLYFRQRMHQRDISRTIINAGITTMVELCVGVCICCMPATLRMYRKSQEKNSARILKSHKEKRPYTTSGAHSSANGLCGQAYQLERPGHSMAEVTTGEVYDLSDDRIHLRFDMQQPYGHEAPAKDMESFV